MNKKIEKMFITGIDTLRRGNCQVYQSKEELEEAFDEQQIDIDEEILEIASPMFVDVRYPSTALEFARAILKKAREK